MKTEPKTPIEDAPSDPKEVVRTIHAALVAGLLPKRMTAALLAGETKVSR